MSFTAGLQSDGRWRGAPRRREPARGDRDRGGLRSPLQALHRWWAKQRYRPERRYMRG